MSKYSIEGQTLTHIADARREKTGDTAALTAAAMAEAIASISGGGGGLEYETGEWTAPDASTRRWTIPFANEHNKPPAFAGWIATSGYLTSSSDCIYSFAISYDLLLGTRFDMGNDTYRYGRVVYGSKNGTSRISASQSSIIKPSEDVGTGTGYYTYYADKDAIYPDTGSNSKYFPQTITYKWIAIWAPEA